MQYFYFILQDGTVRLWNIEDSDKIPIVLEKRRAIGLKMAKVCSARICIKQEQRIIRYIFILNMNVVIFVRSSSGSHLTQFCFYVILSLHTSLKV